MATSCREAGDVCDLGEYCDGVSEFCPSDAYIADGTDCQTDEVCNVTVDLRSCSYWQTRCVECDSWSAVLYLVHLSFRLTDEVCRVCLLSCGLVLSASVISADRRGVSSVTLELRSCTWCICHFGWQTRCVECASWSAVLYLVHLSFRLTDQVCGVCLLICGLVLSASVISADRRGVWSVPLDLRSCS